MNEYVISAYLFGAFVFIVNGILAWRQYRGPTIDET